MIWLSPIVSKQCPSALAVVSWLGKATSSSGAVHSFAHPGSQRKHCTIPHIYSQIFKDPSVGMQTGAATVENGMEFSQKTKNGTAFDPAILLLGIYPKNLE